MQQANVGKHRALIVEALDLVAESSLKKTDAIATIVVWNCETTLPKRVEPVAKKFFRQRTHPPRSFASDRPSHDFPVILKAVKIAEPYVLLCRRDQHDVRNVARAQTAADSELDVFEEAKAPPFRLEPVHGYCRLSPIGLSATAPDANGNLADHHALRSHGMADTGHLVAKPFWIIYHGGV